jgi:CPA1 family monovalent cation:H+ antiporter
VYVLVGGAARLAHPRGLSHGLPLAWLHAMFWSGLRGAVSVALALSLPDDFPQRDLLVGTTYGVVLFTLLVQGTTSGPAMSRLGLRTEPTGVDPVD